MIFFQESDTFPLHCAHKLLKVLKRKTFFKKRIQLPLWWRSYDSIFKHWIKRSGKRRPTFCWDGLCVAYMWIFSYCCWEKVFALKQMLHLSFLFQLQICYNPNKRFFSSLPSSKLPTHSLTWIFWYSDFPWRNIQ